MNRPDQKRFSKLEPVASAGSDGYRSVIRRLKGKERVAGVAPAPRTLRLQETALSVLGTIGANVMVWAGGRLICAQNQYERSAPGFERFVGSLHFKGSVKLYHFLFCFQQSIYQRKLALSRPDELILEIAKGEFHCSGIRATPVRIAESLARYLYNTETAANEFSRRLTALDQLIVVHPNLPIPAILKQSTTPGAGDL
tara:strand:- start:2358 stop:2951 length:594 start_codon:yes stop_codon:yes gene_type:complete